MGGTWTLPGISGGVYVTPEDVRCDGMHMGARCDKLLAESLIGEMTIKCGRCGHRQTVKRKALDIDP